MTSRPDLDPAAWIATPITAELVRGALELERTDDGVLPHRLPARARAQCADTQLALAEAQPSGVRLALRTAATVVELAARPTKTVYQGGPARPDGVYDLLVGGRLAAQGSVPAGNVLTVDLANGSAATAPGPAGTVRFAGLPPGDKDVEIWLPHREITELVGLRADAPIEPRPARARRAWLHHGGSISHGADAASPSAIWPAVVFFMGEEARVALDLRTAGLGLAYCDDVVVHHHPATSGAGEAAKRALAARNRALTAWMRRPVRVAAAGTVALLRAARTEPAARRAAAQLLGRLPAALARRRPVGPDVEAELAALAAAEECAARVLSGPGPSTPARGPG